MNADRIKLEGPLSGALIGARNFFTKAKVSDDQRTLHKEGGRSGDAFYRDRWSHDKVVRSTHGVNCTGSCSWKVYVKDGIITWEAQQTDYPSTGADRPEYEPRGCPRGAAFSWYTYSPTRVRYPYIRGVLLEMFRAAKAELGDPVRAWASIVDDPEKAKRYKSARGKGGLVRASWAEAAEMYAAANVHTIRKWGPDRIAGFSPIPAMSMVSHASGARFTSLIGGSMLSFYDWYADLPVASPQIFGDQTDVPESGDWWDAGYLVMWGSNVPVTRTPDAHWMTEARYRGQKVVVVAPDYADNVKFADEWLAAAPGTDGALAMAMGHVVLKEFFVDSTNDYFDDYVKKYTDLPYLVVLDEAPPGTESVAYAPGKFLTASDLSITASSTENADFKPVLIDGRSSQPVVPNGSLGHRFGKTGAGRWNLDLQDVDPQLSLYDDASAVVEVLLPRFDVDGETVTRGVPVRRIDGHLVTTVYDLMLAQYGVGRDDLPGEWPSGYDDASTPYTPAWQEPVTSVPAEAVARIAREFAQNAADSKGRSMIIVGAGANHWFHSDTIYRCMLMLTTITGCQGVNGGGWAHYVGQEKARPITGWAQLAFGLDWVRPPRQMIQTGYWYLHTDQFRYDNYGIEHLVAPTATGKLAGMGTADALALSARMGWMPSYPTFNRNPLDLADEVEASGQSVGDYVVDQLQSGELAFACEDPDAPENWPRVLTMWRANLFGSSGKGNEYFLKHLLGTESSVRADETPEHRRPRDIVWHDEAPEGKLDLLCTLDFRMTSSTILSDIVLPAATWYEKHDISTTDMHPFIHSFNPAIAPPWQTKTDWDIFQVLAESFAPLAKEHLGVRKGPGGRAAAARHCRGDGNAPRHREGLEEGRVRAGPGHDDAQAGGRRARLWRRRREDGRARPADGEAGCHHQGDHLRRQRRDRLSPREERSDQGRGGRRQAEPEDGHRGGGDDHGALRDHQRTPRYSGLPDARAADRHDNARPRRRARGEEDHLRRHPGGACAGDHQPGVVGLGDRRAALQPVHHQHRAAQAVAHPHRAAALLPGPRLDAGAWRDAAGVQAPAGHERHVR